MPAIRSLESLSRRIHLQEGDFMQVEKSSHSLWTNLLFGWHTVQTIQRKRKMEELQLWRDALMFMAKGPSATLEFLNDEPRALLWAYWMQAMDGACPDNGDNGTGGFSDERLRRKREAWRALGDMPRAQAQRSFLVLLSSVLPEWRSWCEQNAVSIRKEQECGGEAERLLKAFRSKTGFLASSRL